MPCIGALREGNPELGVWLVIRDLPARALKFGPRPWEKTSAPGCPVHLLLHLSVPVGVESSISCS